MVELMDGWCVEKIDGWMAEWIDGCLVGSEITEAI